MTEKTKFMETLFAVAEIARAQGCRITKEEIKKYFNENDLTEMQYQHIYTYLNENKIVVDGFEARHEIPEEEKDHRTEGRTKGQTWTGEIYQRELKQTKRLTRQEELALFTEWIHGAAEAREMLISAFLKEVVSLADQYGHRGLSREDLIQEGNIGLLYGMEAIRKLESGQFCREILIKSIKDSMEAAIDAEMADSERIETIVAKTNLIYEAAQYLAEEYGRLATLWELSQYTRIPEEEIGDILELSLGAVSIGQGEKEKNRDFQH